MAANTGDVILGVSVELLVLGLAVGVAGVSDDVGSIMVVFMVGVLIAWMMAHVSILRAVPNLLNYAKSKGAG